ncbi:MAG TPA: hypothetical protein RWN64_08805 [Ruminococcus sp.]
MNLETDGMPPICVSIDGFDFFADAFKISCTQSIKEQNTLNSDIVYTGINPKTSKLFFKGRIYGSDASAFTVKAADLIKSSKNINLTYKTLVFSNCRLISFVGEENADGFLHADLEFATVDDIGEAEGNG